MPQAPGTPRPFSRGRRRATLRAILERIAPPAAGFDDAGRDEAFSIIDGVLAERPAAMRRQLALFLLAIDVLAVLTGGRTFRRLAPAAQDRLLRRLEHAPVPLVRSGFWGLKAVLLMGCYGRDAVRRSIGYRPNLRGGGLRKGVS